MDPLDAAQALAVLLGPIGGFLVGLKAAARGDHIVKELAELSSIRSDIGESQRPTLDTVIAVQLHSLLERRRYRLNRKYVFDKVYTMVTLGVAAVSLFLTASRMTPPWSVFMVVAASVFASVIFYDLTSLIRHRYLAPVTHRDLSTGGQPAKDEGPAAL